MGPLVHHLPRFALVLCLTVLVGCAKSAPTRTYVLSYSDDPAVQEDGSSFRDGPIVGVGPVDLPPYLNRLGIVTRDGANVLVIAEFDQWGDQLDVNFSRVLTERLSRDLATDRIIQYPWKFTAAMDYQIIVDVTKFETDSAGRSRLDARWSVLDGETREILVMARSKFTEPTGVAGDTAVGQESFAAIAAAMGRNIDALGQEIAVRVKALSNP